MEIEQEIEYGFELNKKRKEKEKKPIKEKLADFIFIIPAYLALILFVFLPIGFALIVSFFKNPTVLDLRNAFSYYFDLSNYTSSIQSLIALILASAAVVLGLIYFYKFLSKKFNITSKFRILIHILLVFCGIILIFIFNIIYYYFAGSLFIPPINTSNLSRVSTFNFFFRDDQFGKGVFIIGGMAILFVTILMIWYTRIAYHRLPSIQLFDNKIIRGVVAFLLGSIFAPLTLFIFEWIVRGLAFFKTIGLPIEEYRRVLTAANLDFIRILFNTFFWTLFCTVLHIILGMGLALLLNRKFAGRGFFRSLFILPWAIPSFVSTLIWRAYVFDKDSGILGSLTSQFGNSASFTVGNLFILILATIASILIVVYSYKLLSKSRKSLLFLLAIFESVFLPMILTIFMYNKIGFTYGIKIVTLIYLVILSIAILGYYLYIKNKLREPEVKISPGLRPLIYLILANICIILILLFNDLFQLLFGQFQESLGYKIIDIPEIKSTFWYTDDIYIFGLKFKMITFSAILINVWLGVPFMMLSFLATLQTIPQELYEAAEIDGLSSWGQFKKVTLPLLKPTLLTVSLLGIIWTFNLFNVVYLLSQNQTGLGDAIWYDIFVTFIYHRFYDQADYSGAAALSFTVFIILVSFSLVYRKLIKVEDMWESEK